MIGSIGSKHQFFSIHLFFHSKNICFIVEKKIFSMNDFFFLFYLVFVYLFLLFFSGRLTLFQTECERERERKKRKTTTTQLSSQKKEYGRFREKARERERFFLLAFPRKSQWINLSVYILTIKFEC